MLERKSFSQREVEIEKGTYLRQNLVWLVEVLWESLGLLFRKVNSFPKLG